MAHDKTCKVCGGTEVYKSGACAPCARKKAAICRAENRELCRQKNRAWIQANPEKAKNASLKWNANNKDKRAESRKKYHEQNPEKVRETQSAYRKRNPELFKLYKHNRRSRESGGNLTVGIIGRLLVLQKGKCACCKQPLGADFHLDHILPLALGGSSTDENMQLLRAGCNLKKHMKHPVDYMQSKGYLL